MGMLPGWTCLAQWIGKACPAFALFMQWLQGVAAAKNAWKKKNVQPVTKKDEKKARPTGRGDGVPQGQRGGRRGIPFWHSFILMAHRQDTLGTTDGCKLAFLQGPLL